jgi:hypothetical protein
MTDWDRIVNGALRPARPRIDRCMEAYRAYVAAVADRMHGHARTLADIENRLSRARERVFAEGSGKVPAEVTAIEREWLAAARSKSPARELETLWRQIAPERWQRPVPEGAEAMVTLASDPDGVDAAERAAASLREALAPWGVTLGPRVQWVVSRELTFAVRAEELFAAPLATCAEAAHDVVQRGHRVRRDLRDRLGPQTIPTRNSSLAREIGIIAFGSTVREQGADPFAPALEIYALGYALTAADAAGVTITAVAIDRP